jgi:uncharacterized membrane protein
VTTILVLYLVGGVLLIALAIPLLFNKIPPNSFYGFRVTQTTHDSNTWYAVNRYSARWLLFAGVSSVVAAILLYFIPGISVDAYALGCLAVFTATFTLGLVKSFLYMKSLKQ